MRGHEEASGTKYVPNELFKKWSKKDPVVNFEKFLINQKLFTEEKIENTKASIKKEINIAIEKAFNESQIECDLDFENHPFLDIIILTKSNLLIKKIIFVLLIPFLKD